MTARDIVNEYKKITGCLFITASQLTKTMGRSDQTKVKNKYLSGLEAVEGKYYFIPDVAARLDSMKEIK